MNIEHNPKMQIRMKYSMDRNNSEYKSLIADLYEKWTQWDEHAFEDFFSNKNEFPSFKIEKMKDPEALGSFLYPRDRKEWMYAKITLSETVLSGEQKDFQKGPEYRTGRILFLYDVLLHEMIHHFIEFSRANSLSAELIRDTLFDEERAKRMVQHHSYADVRHGVIYTKKANIVAHNLGLPLVNCLFPSEDLKLIDCGGRLSKYFPMCCKARKDYGNAYLGSEYCSD